MEFKNIFNKKELLILLLLTLLALVIRLYNVVDQMPFTYDQGRDLLALLSMKMGKPALIGPTTGIDGVFLGPFYFYFLFPAFLLFKGDPGAVMIWLTCWTTIVLPFFFYILKPITGKFWAWIGFIVLIFLPGSIMDARVIWNPSLAPSLLILGIWSLLLSQEKPKFLIFSALTFALALQTELAYFVFLLPALFIWVISQRQKYNLKVIVLSFLMVLLTVIPQLVFEIRHQFIMTQSIVRETNRQDHKISLIDVWIERPSQISRAMSNRFFTNLPGESILFISMWLLMLYVLVAKKNENIEKLIFSFVIFPIVGLMFHTGNNGYFFDYYLNPSYVPLLLAIILSLNKITKNKQVKLLLAGVVLVSIGLSFIGTAKIIYNPEVLQYTYKKQIQALVYPREHHSTDDYAIEVFVPNLLPINYEYLHNWINRFDHKKADFFRHEHNEYFIIYEPASAGGSEVAFQEWWKRHTGNADCTFRKKIGIITVEQCFRK